MPTEETEITRRHHGNYLPLLLSYNFIKITLDFWKNAYKYKEHNWWTAHRAKLEAERLAKEEEERKAREEELAA